MQKRILFFLQVLLILLVVPLSTLFSQIPGWKYAQYYEVDNTGNTEDIINYQVRITFNHLALVNQGRSRSDGGDIRFSLCDGTIIRHWFEWGLNYSSTGVWIKVPYVAARSKIVIMMNYGNSAAQSISNPDSVMDFYDDFDSGIIDQNKWLRPTGSNIQNGYLQPVQENMSWGGSNYIYSKKNFGYLNNRGVIECEVRSTQNNSGGNIIFFSDAPNTPAHYLLQHETRFLAGSDGDFGYRSAGASGDLQPPLLYQWTKDERVYNYIRISSKTSIYHNRYNVSNSGRQISGSVTGSMNLSWSYIGFSTFSGFPANFEVNYVRVRKWCPREPAVRTTNTSVLTTNPVSVDFGWLVCQNDSLKPIVLTNNGNDPFNITNISFIKDTLTQFFFSASGPLILQAKESQTFTMNFNPVKNGIFEDTLIIRNSNPCIPPTFITVTGKKDTIKVDVVGVEKDTIDFGVRCLEGIRDTTFSVLNNSSVPTTISSTTFSHPFSFSGTNPLYKQFDLGESRDVRLNFNGINLPEGLYLDSLSIIDTCGNYKTIFLKAVVAQPSFTFIKDTIDFGECTLWCDSIRTDSIQIVNTSPFGVRGILLSWEMYGLMSSSEITQLKLIKNDTLANNTTTSYQIIFTPKDSRDYSDSLKIILFPCNYEKTIYLKGRAVKASVKSARYDYDLGSVKMNDAKDTTVVFKNDGTAPIVISQIDGIVPPFSLISTVPPLPASLLPGNVLDVNIRFKSKDTLSYQIELICKGNPCDVSDSVPVFAKSVPIVAKTLIYIPNTHGKSGERITIPLVLESSNNLIQSGIDAFSAIIQMNKTMLKPLNIESDSMQISGNIREVRIRGTWDRPDGILYNFEFIPTLGDSECTDIKITQFQWLNGLSSNDLISGRFCLTDVCKEGGDRLFNETNRLALLQSRPNPASSETVIEFETIEEGITKLYIVDMLGKRISTLSDGFMKPGRHKVKCDVSYMESGIYFYVLQTPSHLLKGIMGVVK
ncbi:MAG: DUF2341 domain-containing protein [Bacteroidota bacterium]